MDYVSKYHFFRTIYMKSHMKWVKMDQRIAKLQITHFFESKDLESNGLCIKITFFPNNLYKIGHEIVGNGPKNR